MNYELTLDFALLAKQKSALQRLMPAGEDLDGILGLIDSIQDQSVSGGVAELVVFPEMGEDQSTTEKPYTVIAVYEDNLQPFIDFTTAHTPDEAKQKIVEAAVAPMIAIAVLHGNAEVTL